MHYGQYKWHFVDDTMDIRAEDLGFFQLAHAQTMNRFVKPKYFSLWPQIPRLTLQHPRSERHRGVRGPGKMHVLFITV